MDAFQGRQKDCVIVTCVRANAMQGSIGWVTVIIDSLLVYDPELDLFNHC